MPIRELADILSNMTDATRNGRRFARAGKRAADNFRRMDHEQRLSLGKRAIGEALLYASDVLCGPDVRGGGED